MNRKLARLVTAWSVVLGVICAGGCTKGPCTYCGWSPGVQQGLPCEGVYIGRGDPYQAGPLSVRTIRAGRCEGGAPLDLLVYTPEPAGSYSVVVFQHGFMTHNSAYSGILRHLASHGFVAVAPQMYEPGVGPLLGRPTAAEEADWAAVVLDWLPGNLDSLTGVRACTDRLGLAGHSRGGKVAWLVLSKDAGRAMAVAGVDPVDGTGGPLGGEARVVNGPFGFPFPSLVIGTGLGGTCAPEGDNHVQFYGASASPAWHIVVPHEGHVDMLDEDSADFAMGSKVCTVGADPAGMRRLTAGVLVAFFRGALQGDRTAFDYLTNVAIAPIEIEVEAK